MTKKEDQTVSVSSVIKKWEVSKSGYDEYIKRKPSHTKKRREKITKEVEKVYKESHEIYGLPKITQILNKNGEKVSQKYIHSIMKENNWKGTKRKLCK